jgi:1-acyl-sn-glycerol-3-phosphate acyltransferase
LYHLEKFLIHLILLLFVRFQVNGLENIPRTGALLVVANHLCVADPPIIGASLRRRLKFMAKEELFRNWFFSFAVRQFGAFPVYRGSSSRYALHQPGDILRSEGSLVMFPEGKRSRSGGLQTGQPGAALIAYHNRCNVLPVGISGSENIRGLKWIFTRPSVSLNIGVPYRLPEGGHSLSRQQLSEYTDNMMHRIAWLLPEGYRGQYKG